MDVELILGELNRQGGASTLLRLLAALCSDDDARVHMLPVFWHLVAMGHLQADLDKPFEVDVQVVLAGVSL